MKTNSYSYAAVSDLAMAAAISLWEPIEDVDKSKPRAIFIFADNERVRGLIAQYYKGSIQVEPRKYFDQIRALKSRLYA